MNKEARPSSKWTWTFGVVAALLVYVLSWGPVKAYYYVPHARPILDGRCAEIFYAPVERLLQGNPSLERVSEHYWHWWLYKMYPPTPSRTTP